jgi:catechol 2,3-dioxygenase-like lactoylglutathione lyase family enzyme
VARQHKEEQMHLYRVVLPVSNIERATVYYRALLGAPGERVSAGQHNFDCEGTILTVRDPHADGTRSYGGPNQQLIYFAVDDLEHLHGHAFYVPGGVVDPTIATLPSGQRCFQLRDPFGNPLCFVDRATLLTHTSSALPADA